MEMLEIISLRSLAQGCEEMVGALLAEAAGPAARQGLTLELYRHASVGTDLSVHLHRSHGGAQASPLGLHLAAALREHGQVSHSIWSLAESFETSDRKEANDP